jgi:hypothetical protein
MGPFIFQANAAFGMRAKILGFLAVFVAFFAVLPSVGQDGPQVPHAKPYVDPDAYAIYAVLLTAQREKFVVIESEMQYLPSVEESGIKGGPEFTKVWGAALADYVDKFHQEWTLTHDLPLDVPYELVTKAQIGALFKSSVWSGWQDFARRYPGARGYYWFSAVGFNAEKTHAIVQMNNLCGGLCGGGSPHFLEKVDGKWRVVKVTAEYSVWAS